HFQDGDTHQFRKLTAWSEIRLELSDPAPAAAPGAPPPTYKLKAAIEDPGFKGKSGIRVSELERFLKWTSGAGGVNKPADFGQYPAVLHRLWSALPDFETNAPYVAEFLAHVVGPTPFDPDFRA